MSSGHRREGPDFATRDRGRGEAIKKEGGKGEERERERERERQRERITMLPTRSQFRRA